MFSGPNVLMLQMCLLVIAPELARFLDVGTVAAPGLKTMFDYHFDVFDIYNTHHLSTLCLICLSV